MKPYKSAGKRFHEFIDDAVPPIPAETFREKLINYLREQCQQDLLPFLSEERINELYELTSEFFKENYALVNFRPVLKSRDWRKRKRLLNTLDHRITDIETLLSKSCADDLPLTTLLASSVLKKIGVIRREVGYVSWSLRGDEGLYRMAKKVSPATNFMSVLEDYFTQVLPELQKQQWHLLIAAAAVAAGVFTEDEIRQDILHRIPMRLSRPRKAYRGVEVVFPGRFKRKTIG